MSIPEVLDTLKLVTDAAEQARAQLVSMLPKTTTVRAGDSLQAALDAKLPITVEPGAIFVGTFYYPSGTKIAFGQGAGIRGEAGPAVDIRPGTSLVQSEGGTFGTNGQEVISIGLNTSEQTQVSQAPVGISFTGAYVPKHLGKRAFAVHGYDVTLNSCVVDEVYSPAGADSQAIYIGNAPGKISVIGGSYRAGSMPLLAGGDTMRIPGLTPDGLLFDGVDFGRPLSWKTDGVYRKVKNIFELKNARNVRVLNCKFHGNWVQAQNGFAILFTPALDGAITNPVKQSGEVLNVLFDGCAIYDCGAAFNMLGRHYTSFTPNALSGVVIKNTTVVTDKAQYGGTGQLAQLTGEPGSIEFDNVTGVTNGSSSIYVAQGTVLDPVTLLSRLGGKVGSLKFTNGFLTAPTYGIMVNGSANALNWQNGVAELAVHGNIFGGSTAMAKYLPSNQYLTSAEFATLPQVQQALAAR